MVFLPPAVACEPPPALFWAGTSPARPVLRAHLCGAPV